MKRALPTTLLIVLCYAGAYFAALSLPFSLRMDWSGGGGAGTPPLIESKFLSINGELIANYHGIPESFFAPIHALDKNYLRHDHWFTPRDQEQSFDWLLSGLPTPADRK